MNDDVNLSLTDVAEALECTIFDVRRLIDGGELLANSGARASIAHSELARFVQTRRNEHLVLGIDNAESVDFALLRPRGE
jgi:hypothetical protein